VCNRGHLPQGLERGHAARAIRPGWSSARSPHLADDVWELYDTTKDWSQAHDLAKQMPERVAELDSGLFDLEASKYNVFPLDDRKAERTNPDISGRPQVVRGNSQLFFPGMRRMSENSVINIKNKSHAVTANIVVPDGGATGWLRRMAEILAAGASMRMKDD
jgi:arylsulfatase